MSRYHILHLLSIRFLFLSLLFHHTRTSALFNLAFRSLRIFSESSSPAQIESTAQRNEEGFTLITGSSHHIISEIEYEQVLSDIKRVRNLILRTSASFPKRVEIIERIVAWRENPINKFSLPWKEHFQILTEIFHVRSKNTFIPNSIIKEYLIFLVDNVILPNRNTFKYSGIIDKTVSLLTLMIKNVTNTIFIDLILENVYSDFRNHQILSLFNSFYLTLPQFSTFLEKNSGKERQKAFFRVAKVYLKLFNHFHRSSIDILALKHCFPIPRIFMPFFDFLPVYQALMTEESDHLRNFSFNPILRCHECIGILNFLLKETDFNNAFSSSAPRVMNKISIFRIIKGLLFRDEKIYNILAYCLDNRLIYAYEFFLIYSDSDEVLFEACCSLLEKFMTNRKYTITLYASLLAVSSRITTKLVDDLLMKLLTENPNRQDINVPAIRGFRVIIAATQNIPNNHVWDMSEQLIHLLASEPFDSKDHYFYHAARVYLYRRFSIPFTCTHFADDTAEEVDWVEAIGFINFFLQRESAKAKIVDVIQITTTHK